MTRALLLALALSTSGCFFRLSDPVWAFKSLRAAEPVLPGRSLVFGSLEVDGGFFGIGSLDGIWLRRVGPGEPIDVAGATEETLFRVFGRREMKDGHYLMQLPPGVYELVLFTGRSWGNPARLHVGEDARVASRFTITRPGIYDMGVLHVEQGSTFGSNYHMTTLPPSSRPERAELLRDAVAGTGWERFLQGTP